jgi:uncharacterized protein YycO
MKKMVEFALKQVGSPYDYKFDAFTQSSQAAFYCSELVYSSIIEANKEAQFELRDTLGVKTVTPDDLANMVEVNKFSPVMFVSNEVK